MKLLLKFISVAIVFFSLSCEPKRYSNPCYVMTDTSEYEMDNGNPLWLSARKISLASFINHVKCRDHTAREFYGLIIENNFPENWIKPSDIDSLIPLVNSRQKCNCIVNPKSSIMEKDSAELGGYAIAFIDAFRENRKFEFGLNFCPKTNERKSDELIKWWNEIKPH